VAASSDQDWRELMERRLRQLARRVIDLERRGPVIVMTPGVGNYAPAAVSAPAVKLPEVRHADDFRAAHWFGRDYQFSPAQAMVVEKLWAAWESGIPDVALATLIEAAESDGKRLDTLFRDNKGRLHAAWEVMIVRSRRGFYRLERPDC
jgi:hypothetical protein